MATVHDAPTGAPPAPRRNAWRVVGGILTGVVLLVAIASTGVRVWIASSPWETDSRTETYADPVVGFDVNVPVGQVNLTGGDGPGLQITREVTWRGSEPVLHEELTATGVFEARGGCIENLFFWIGGDHCKIDYSAAVPSGAAAEVRTDVADVNVDGLDGELRLTSSVGGIDAQRLRTTDTVIETNVGDVTVAFEEMRGDIDITTSVGDVTVLVPDDGTTYRVHFDSSVGNDDIRIATDPTGGADHLITVTSSVGDLEVRYVP